MSQWTAAVLGFEAHLASTERSPATCDGYLRHVGWLAESVGVGPWELQASRLGAWLDEHNWSRETRRKVLVSLRAFYAWGVSEGLCEWSPTAGVATHSFRQPGPKQRSWPPAWQGPLEQYLAWLRAGGRSDGTLEVRRLWLSRLAEVAPDPWVITTQQLAQWISNPDWALETKRCAVSSVRSFYRWGLRTRRITESAAEWLDPVQRHRTLPRPVPGDVLGEALRAADDRARLMMKLAAYAGLRRAEIASLHTRNISDDEILVIGKGGHHRRVPLHPDLAGELAAERSRREAKRGGPGWTGYLFPSRDGGPLTPAHVGVLVSRLLPEGWTCHTLRHRFATMAYGVERDLRAVQDLLGHAKPETTAIYAAVPDGALRSAVLGIGPAI